MHYVCILKCVDGDLYIGCTENIEERLVRHDRGYVPATVNRLPVELLSYVGIPDKYAAFELEKYLKSGSGRAFIKKHFTQ